MQADAVALGVLNHGKKSPFADIGLGRQHLAALGLGPGDVFLQAGVRAGLDRATAMTLAAQTVAGAAELLLKSGQHPGELKDMVSSPGGTTITGLHVLEQGGFKGLIMDAIIAATERSQELGTKS